MTVAARPRGTSRRSFGRDDFPVDTATGRHRFRTALAVGETTARRSSTPGEAIPFKGTAIVFNTRAWIGSGDFGFFEQIAPQAVTETLAADDIRFLQNHDPSFLLARTSPAMRSAGIDTLRLSPTPAGLLTEADMIPTSYAHDLEILLRTKTISQMSFAFDPLTWTREDLADGSMLITITSLRLYDVSVVTYPAYVETDASLRSARGGRASAGAMHNPSDLEVAAMRTNLLSAQVAAMRATIGTRVFRPRRSLPR